MIIKKNLFFLVTFLTLFSFKNSYSQVTHVIDVNTQTQLDNVFNQLADPNISFNDKAIFIYPNTDANSGGAYKSYTTDQNNNKFGFTIRNKNSIQIMSNDFNNRIVFKGKEHNPNNIEASGTPMITIENSDNISIEGIFFTDNWGMHAKGIHIWSVPVDYYTPRLTKDISITNCAFENIGWHTNPKANPVINNNTIATANAIIAVGDLNPTNNNERAITNLQIKDNFFYNIITGYSETISLNGNIDDFNIENNNLSHITNIGIDAAGHYSWTIAYDTSSAAENVNFSRNGLIKGNYVGNFIGREDLDVPAAIYIDGGSDNIVELNYVENFPMGYSVDCEVHKDKLGNKKAYYANNNIIRYNTAINCPRFGLLVGAASFLNQENPVKEEALSFVNNTEIYGNTFKNNNVIEDPDNDGYPNDYGQITLQNNTNTTIEYNTLRTHHNNRYAMMNLDHNIFTTTGLQLNSNTIENTVNCIYPTDLANNFPNACITSSYNNLAVNNRPIRKYNHKLIYPNPTSRQLNITNLINDNTTIGIPIKIYDLNGRKIINFHNATETIDVSSLQPGVYILKTGDKIVRFTKQ